MALNPNFGGVDAGTVTGGAKEVAPAEAPKNLSLNDFYSIAGKEDDLAKSARFLVTIIPPAKLTSTFPSGYAFSDLTFLCESAELPGRGLIASDIRYYGPSYKIPYQSQYEDTNLTFLVRDRWNERRFFDNWMELINPQTSYDFSYRNDYISTVTVFAMSDLKKGDQGQQRYQWRLFEAYPILISGQQVTWADDNFHRLTVTLTYKKWFRPGYDKTINEGGSFYSGVKGQSSIPTLPTSTVTVN